MAEHDEMLKALGDLIMCGALTPSKVVTNESLVCFVGHALDGSVHFRQAEFAQLPREMQRAVLHQKKGYKVGAWKVVGIFDVWEPDETPAKPVIFAKN